VGDAGRLAQDRRRRQRRAVHRGGPAGKGRGRGLYRWPEPDPIPPRRNAAPGPGLGGVGALAVESGVGPARAADPLTCSRERTAPDSRWRAEKRCGSRHKKAIS
jgi:hypothetical protein